MSNLLKTDAKFQVQINQNTEKFGIQVKVLKLRSIKL